MKIDKDAKLQNKSRNYKPVDKENSHFIQKILAIYINNLISDQVKDIKAFRDLVLKTLKSQKSRAENFYGRLEGNNPDRTNEDSESINFLNQMHMRLHHDRHHDFLVKASLIALYSSFELVFTETSTWLSRAHNEIKKYEKTEGTGVLKCKKYLETHRKFDFSTTQKHWDDLEHFKNLRNILAHSNGRVTPEFEKRAKKLIKNSKGISRGVNLISIEPSYLDNTIILIETLLKDLKEKVDENSQRALV